MRTARALTLIEVVVVLVGAITLVALLLPMLSKVREKSHRPNCRNNQKLLMLAAMLYRDGEGKTVRYPPFDGSSFLTHLYVTGFDTEGDQYVCPLSDDDNAGMTFATGPIAHACTSYAGRMNAHQGSYPGLYSSKGASETTTVSDDGEGDAVFNGHDACCVMGFLDGHVEEILLDDPRVAGQTHVGGGGLLDPLGN